MIIPEKLKKGDVVGVIAPSDSIEEKDKEYIEKSTQLMEKQGLLVELGKNVYSNTLGYGMTPQEKADDIHYMFKNPKVKAIFCVKGGENSNSLFEYLDYDLIKNNPKILCGFSDSTSITNIITDKTGIVTYNGSTFKSLTSWETDYAYKQVIKRFVEGSLELGTKEDEFKIINKGFATGRLIGGNLSLMHGLVCGKFAVDFTGKILFLEELGLEANPTRVSNYLYYLKQNGVFEKIKGIWLGNYEHESGVSIEKILGDVLENKYNFPVIKSNNFGHIDKKVVIPIGQMATIDTNCEIKIKLLEENIE